MMASKSETAVAKDLDNNSTGLRARRLIPIKLLSSD